MKVCIFGAGALGGHLAAHLIAANQAEVAVVGRGPNLAAIHERGITLNIAGRDIGGKPAVATDNPASLPSQDIVFVSLKLRSPRQISRLPFIRCRLQLIKVKKLHWSMGRMYLQPLRLSHL